MTVSTDSEQARRQREACDRIYATYGNRLDLFFHDAQNNLPWGTSAPKQAAEAKR